MKLSFYEISICFSAADLQVNLAALFGFRKQSRPSWKEERKLNVETFGTSDPRRGFRGRGGFRGNRGYNNYNGYRGRGRGGGGGGGYRGGYSGKTGVSTQRF